MVLGILNLEGNQNCRISLKVTTILLPFFQKKKKISNIGMWGCLSRGVIDCNNIELHTQILIWGSMCEVGSQKTLSEMGPTL